MKKGLQISLTIILVILTLSFYLSDAQVIEDWFDSATDASTFLDVSGSTFAHVDWSPPHTYKPNGNWYVGSSAYASASASPIGDNTSYDATAWVQATGDTANASIPDKSNIDTNRTEQDSEGRSYFYDSHGNGESEVAYKKHPVASTVQNWWDHFWPWAEQVTRSFDLSIYCYYSDTHPTTPTNLTADPHMVSEISGDSNQFVNIGLGNASIAAP